MVMSMKKYHYDVQFTNENNSGSSSSKVFFLSPRSTFNKRIVIGIVLVVIVVAVAVGVGVGVSLNSNDSEEQKSETAEQHSGDWITAPCHSSRLASCPWSSPPLLLVSLDGFRASYLQRDLTPTIDKLQTCGVHTPYMRATYPTLTFPNHYTIVTGLYPESHGIVGNSMYDPDINKLFFLYTSEKSNPKWWKGEPIWITAKKQGKTTASYFWVGSDVNISGIYPDIWFPYDGRVPFEHRVDTVLEWLMKNESRPDFMTLYFNEPDHIAHSTGPDSSLVNDKLKEVDSMISRLMNGLYQNNLDHCVNIIILADHGMTDTSCDRQVVLKKFKVKDTESLIFTGSMGRIFTKYKKSGSNVVPATKVITVKEILNNLHCKNPHINTFTKDSLPKRHHYSNSDRIGDVVIDVDDRWLLSANVTYGWCLQGNHGYDNIYKSMHALFLAHGPSFKEEYTAAPFENIELYNLMTDLLGISPAPNNGTQGSLRHLLNKKLDALTKNHTYDYKSYNKPAFHAPTCVCPHRTQKSIIKATADLSNYLLVPKLTMDENAYMIHREKRKVAAYSTKFKGPLWIFSDQTWSQKSSPRLQNVSCLIPDLDVEDARFCDDYSNIDTKFVLSTLIPQESSVASTSDVVPMYKKFQTGIWSYMWKLVEEYLNDSGMFVNTGPIYDYNSDGLWEGIINETRFVSNRSSVPVPTHFYIVFLRFTTSNHSNFEIQSFIIPHLEEIPNCLTEVDYLKDNIARLRDIELLTGLEFLADVKADVSVPLRLNLPEKLWPSRMTDKWINEQCDTDTPTQCPWRSNPVLLVSLDGFRADYINRDFTPVLKKLSQCGVHTPYMRSAFPTRTFPNHYTIVTGLYPESHGIVGNKMYDADIGGEFSLGNRQSLNPLWWGGEPIWNTVQRFGKKSATFFWPGSEVNITGHYPNEWRKYSGSVTFEERVDTVLEWLSRPDDDRPELITLYFNEPDHTGHTDGPNSVAENNVLSIMDKMIERLMDGLYHRDIHNCVNIIVIADHGMTETTCDRQVLLDNMLNISRILTYGGPFGRIDRHYHKVSNRVGIRPVTDEYTVDEILEKIECNSDHYKVYKKETTPIRYHYTNNKRIGDILIDVADKWLVYDFKRTFCYKGNHGYDNMYKTMHALFLAHGPGFKQDIEVKPFDNIELYNLMSALLEVTPAPNNGTWGSLHHLLRNEPSVHMNTSTYFHYKNVSVPVNNSARFEPDKGCICLNMPEIAPENFTFWENNEKNFFPFGVPYLKVDDDIKILSQREHMIAYSEQKRLPLYSSAILNMSYYRPSVSNISCVLEDSRISSQKQSSCSDLQNSDDIVLGPLFYSVDGVYLTTELVPMYKGFKKGIWDRLMETMANSVYDMFSMPTNVITGPIFDYNYDGHRDGSINATKYVHAASKTPIPSHYFVILLRCYKDSQCNGDEMKIFSFILPHTAQIPNCISSVIRGDKPLFEYFEHNVVRLKDIELLTGFQFGSDDNISVRQRTYMPPKRWWSTEEVSVRKPLCSTVFQERCQKSYQPVLLISLDGFQAKYLSPTNTLAISTLGQCGVHASHMKSVYPTKTFPNQYSIVTGLYPESHGIVDNNMYDENIGGVFGIGKQNSSDPRWWSGEPIWVTAKKQGLKTASYFWVGSEIKGMTPDYYEKYDQTISYNERVKKVLEWMDKPDGERPQFITLYFDEPDHQGHLVGPDSSKINASLEKVDKAIESLMTGLNDRGLLNCVNIMIVADHGMAEKSCNQTINLSNYITSFKDMFVYEGPFGRISTHYRYKSSTEREKVEKPYDVDNVTSWISCQNEHMRVYRPSQLPKRHHYSNNPRIDDIILDLDSGWVEGRYKYRYCSGGDHGYDNIFSSMNALFVAHGPAFKENLKTRQFENIELYNLMTVLLNITGAPNNGTFGSLHHILKTPPALSSPVPSSSYTVLAQQISAAEILHSSGHSGCKLCNINQREAENISSILNGGSSSTFAKYGGFPILSKPGQNVLMLHQTTHTTAFDQEKKTPLWVAFELEPKMTEIDEMGESHLTVCSIPDPRVTSLSCNTDENITTFSLLHPALKTARSLSSVKVPILTGQKELNLKNLTNHGFILLSYFATFRDANVGIISGPIYDYNNDGLADDIDTIRNYTNTTPPVPTHIFFAYSLCQGSVCSGSNWVSYILPVINQPQNCNSKGPFSQYPGPLEEKTARLRDIELLTNLQFLPNLSPSESLDKRLYLHSDINPFNGRL